MVNWRQKLANVFAKEAVTSVPAPIIAPVPPPPSINDIWDLLGEPEGDMLARLDELLTLYPAVLKLRKDIGNDFFYAADLAAGWGSVETLQILKKHGADFNRASGKGLTPLMSAAKRNQYDNISFLLGEKVSIDAQDDAGKTALAHASEFNQRVKTVDLLLAAGASTILFPILPLLAVWGVPETIEGILQRYPRIIDQTDAEGRTGLYHALRSSQQDNAAVFFKYGADAKIISAHSETTLMAACAQFVHAETVNRLLEAGVNPGHKDAEGNTALHYLAKSLFTGAQVAGAQLLLDAGAYIDARNKKGQTPADFIYRAHEGQQAFAEFMDAKMSDEDMVKEPADLDFVHQGMKTKTTLMPRIKLKR